MTTVVLSDRSRAMFAEISLQERVEIRQWLIQDQQLGIAEEGPRDPQALAFASR